MTSRILRITALAAFVGAVSLVNNCRPAVYEIVKPKKDRQNPDNLGPNDSVEPAQPTAAIEVLVKGLAVTKVRVNEPTTIQPTADTVDPDDVGRDTCPNPGIVVSQYKIGSDAMPEVKRDAGCDALGVPYTFTKAGDYLITMIVTSNEGETATASMTLHVIAADAPIDEDGGFLIKANPMIAGIGQEISLSGICTTSKAHQITWSFGDGGTSEGPSPKHAYGKVGAYRIDATCRETANTSRVWTASVTVVVMTKPVVPPVVSTPPGYTYPVPNPGSNAGQNAGQDRPGQGSASQPWGHPWGHQPAPSPGQPGSGGSSPKRCGVFIFTWSC